MAPSLAYVALLGGVPAVPFIDDPWTNRKGLRGPDKVEYPETRLDRKAGKEIYGVRKYLRAGGQSLEEKTIKSN